MNDVCFIYEKGTFAPIRIDAYLNVYPGKHWTQFHGSFKTLVIRTELVDKYIIKKGEFVDGEET